MSIVKTLATLDHSYVYLLQRFKNSASLSASLTLKSLSSKDDKCISESGMSCRRHFLGKFFVNFGHISNYFLAFLLLTSNR